MTQRRELENLAIFYPGYDFPRAYITQEEILDGSHEVKATIWVNGHAGKSDPRSIDVSDIFPEYKFETVDDALSNRDFVFGRV